MESFWGIAATRPERVCGDSPEKNFRCTLVLLYYVNINQKKEEEGDERTRKRYVQAFVQRFRIEVPLDEVYVQVESSSNRVSAGFAGQFSTSPAKNVAVLGTLLSSVSAVTLEPNLPRSTENFPVCAPPFLAYVFHL